MNTRNTSETINKLASLKGVCSQAVQNFLSTLEGMSREDAVANLELDARLYQWNAPTKKAILDGIKMLCEAQGTWGYTQNSGRAVWIPERRFKSLPKGCVATPLRGYGYTLAVFEVVGRKPAKCIGWILKDNLSLHNPTPDNPIEKQNT